MTFHHVSDPDAAGFHSWSFVYFHGAAEDLSDRTAEANGWEWQAPDLLLCSEPMPDAPGIYRGSLYGMPVVAVLGYWRGRWYLQGRVAIDDPKTSGYDHVFCVDDWR